MSDEIVRGILLSILFIGFAIIFCIILLRIYIKKIKEHNQQEIEFQKTLNTSILETQEQLLTSVSEDLHDDAGQQLTVINFQLENLKLDFPEQTKNINVISGSVSHLSRSLREISHSLNTNWLEKNGLLDAIKQDVDRLKKNKTIAIHLALSDQNLNLSSEHQIVIYRMYQEATNNILKHAKSNEVMITICCSPTFKIEIKDNGVGFDSATMTTSNGLINMKKRASILNFTLDINSQINVGTTISISEN